MSGPRPAARKRAWRFVTLENALWAVVVGLLIYRFGPQVGAALGTGGDGPAAPTVAFDMLDGSTVRLSELRGQVVLVNFWATWCPPCRLEMPGFQKVYDAKRAQGFTIIGLSSEAPQRVQAFLLERGIRYPIGVASAEAESAFGGVNGLPTSYLIDRQGRVRYTVRGIFAEFTLAQAVDRLLAEAS